jgi:hypothetical protein
MRDYEITRPDDQLRNAGNPLTVSPIREMLMLFFLAAMGVLVIACGIIGVALLRSETMHHGDTYDT